MSPKRSRHTFVLVHGGFHGGWCWKHVTEMLRERGHFVCTPTHTGLGERAHLLDESLGLETFVQDIVGVLETEELTDVTLVGHSFGAISVTGAADRTAPRLRRLVFLDGILVQGGCTAFDELSPEEVDKRVRAAQEYSGGLGVRPFPPSAFGVTDPEQAEWVRRRVTPHPLRTYRDTLVLEHEFGNDLPCTYIACTNPWYQPVESSREWARSHADWGWKEIPAAHNAMVTHPELVADTLCDVADQVI